MKILLAGDWHSNLHEEPLCESFFRNGHEVEKFAWNSYFSMSKSGNFLQSILSRIQNKYFFGPLVSRLNRDLIQRIEGNPPDFVFIYRGTHIYPKTLKKISIVAPNAVLVGYNNDDPFSAKYPAWMWRHYIKSLPYYDLVLAYREVNIRELKACGARRVELLQSWFLPDRNRPVNIESNDMNNFDCDVVFIGHYEDDGRLAVLEDIAEQGRVLRIFGPGYEWDHILRESKQLNQHVPVNLVWGDEYNKAICGAKVALCFFSKLNRDTYTRRCFEIPAAGVALLSEYSDTMRDMFEPDIEAAYFNNTLEMVEKLDHLLSEDAARCRLSLSGQRRVWRDGHDIDSRVLQIVSWIDNIQAEKYEISQTIN